MNFSWTDVFVFVFNLSQMTRSKSKKKGRIKFFSELNSRKKSCSSFKIGWGFNKHIETSSKSLTRLNTPLISTKSSNLRISRGYPFKLKMFSIISSFTIQMAPQRKRTYQEEFLNHGFTEIEDKGIMKPHCVVCLKNTGLKKSELKKNLVNLHSHLLFSK